MVVQDVKRAFNLAKDWLLHSGIQSIDGPKFTRGGFHGWYDGRGYPFVYSEITGYGVTSLLYLNKLQPDPQLVERAKMAADWLIGFARHEYGGVKTRYYYRDDRTFDPFSFKEETLCAFDAGMVLYGVCLLYEETKEQKYLGFAKELGEFLLKLKKPHGAFYALYNYKAKELVDFAGKWSTQSGSFHAKLSLGLLKLTELTGEERFKEAARGVCDYALKVQKDSGRFIVFRESGFTHLHPHCYSAEGLLYIGQKLGRKDYLGSAAGAVAWALDQQLDDGGVPSLYKNGERVPFERSDVLAQVLRLGLLALDDSYQDKLSRLANRLLSFQDRSEDPAKRGGFKYGFSEEGKKLDHTNSWCTMFAVQALQMYDQRVNKGQKLSVEYLI